MSGSVRYKNLILNLSKAQIAHECEHLSEAVVEIFRACKNTFDCQSGYITLFDERHKGDPFYDEIKYLKSTSEFPSKKNLLKEPVFDNSDHKNGWNKLCPECHAEPENLLISPIVYQDKTTGLICLINMEGGFTEEDLEVASIFTHVAAIAINNFSIEAQIIKSETNYRNLFNNIPVGAYVTDAMDQIVDMNNEMLALLNINSLEDFAGKDILSYYINPDDRIEWQRRLENKNGIQNLETRFRGPDNSVLWISENANLIKGRDGQEYCEVTIEDITTRKRSEEAFTKTYLKLDAAHKELNERAELMWSLNNFLFELAGERSEETIFNTVTTTLLEKFPIKFTAFGKINEDLNSIALTAVKSTQPEQETEIPVECILTRKDLSVLNSSSHNIVTIDSSSDIFNPLDTDFTNLLYNLSNDGRNSIILIPVRYGKIIYGNIIISLAYCDLSANQRYFFENLAEYLALAVENLSLYEQLSSSYEKLESAQESMKKNERIKAMGQIASGITHDINNTLSPITLYTEALIATEENLSERAQRYLKTIQNAVSDIENVAQRLRAFYKKDEELKTEFILINDLFDEIIDLTRPKWEAIPNKEGIIFKIEKNINNYQSFISGCRSDIRESLVNCVFNAVDAMPQGGIIRLSGNIEKDNIKIAIEDEGFGMNEEQLNHCLEPFYTTKGAAGTGLGLAEVYGMMQRHGGEVEIESSLDCGTKINLIFPSVSAAEKEEPALHENTELGRMRILCVDDDKRILEGLSEMFTLDGHLVKTAESGCEALNILEKESSKNFFFDILITDLGMPGMDGYALASKAKSLYPDLPIVMLSGWGSQIQKSDYKSEDIFCILSKPPRINILRDTLRRVSNEGRQG